MIIAYGHALQQNIYANIDDIAEEIYNIKTLRLSILRGRLLIANLYYTL